MSLFYQLGPINLSLTIGVPEEERAQKQTVQVFVKFRSVPGAPNTSDDIKDVPDYNAVYEAVKSVERGAYAPRLVEHLHTTLKERIEACKLPITHLQVEIRKQPYADATILVRNPPK